MFDFLKPTIYLSSHLGLISYSLTIRSLVIVETAVAIKLTNAVPTIEQSGM